ncbi:unnamed protein product, partial [Amoebophrya sp. A25]
GGQERNYKLLESGSKKNQAQGHLQENEGGKNFLLTPENSGFDRIIVSEYLPAVHQIGTSSNIKSRDNKIMNADQAAKAKSAFATTLRALFPSTTSSCGRNPDKTNNYEDDQQQVQGPLHYVDKGINKQMPFFWFDKKQREKSSPVRDSPVENVPSVANVLRDEEPPATKERTNKASDEISSSGNIA